MLSNDSLTERNLVKTYIGKLTSIDSDTGDTYIYTLVSGIGDADNALFQISHDSLYSNFVFDYETKSSANIRIKTTDQVALAFQKQFIIKIKDVDETGTYEILSENLIHIFPNPFSYSTTIWTDIFLKNASLTVYNLQGQVVKQILGISAKSITLYRNNLPDGMYFFRLIENNKVIASEKLIITD